eukprot:3417178-Rhodomonas_salina.1
MAGAVCDRAAHAGAEQAWTLTTDTDLDTERETETAPETETETEIEIERETETAPESETENTRLPIACEWSSRYERTTASETRRTCRHRRGH